MCREGSVVSLSLSTGGALACGIVLPVFPWCSPCVSGTLSEILGFNLTTYLPFKRVYGSEDSR
jgi:hypothetical protein